MLDCMLGKTGKVKTTDAVLTNWSMRSTLDDVFCFTVDWVPLLTAEALHGASVLRGLALLDHVLLLRKIHLEFSLFFSRKNTQAMQDPPELIDVWVVGIVRFW